jgi:hypothetical protein
MLPAASTSRPAGDFSKSRLPGHNASDAWDKVQSSILKPKFCCILNILSGLLEA